MEYESNKDIMDYEDFSDGMNQGKSGNMATGLAVMQSPTGSFSAMADRFSGKPANVASAA